MAYMESGWEERLRQGCVIPAHPLALDASRKIDERHQRALSRYYVDSGAGGLAVGVHTTQFEIHDPRVGLLRPVLTLAAEEMDRADERGSEPLVRVAGICGATEQAVSEAEMAKDLGYHLGLVSLAGMAGASFAQLADHCRAVAEVLGVFGFYLQPKVGGIALPHAFWRSFCEIDNVRAIKVAAFDRYQTLAVVRAVVESGREDIALYTGNDDAIVLDLITPHAFAAQDAAESPGQDAPRHFAGGLLGQWAVWTSQAVNLLDRCRAARLSPEGIKRELLREAAQLTDANGAIFDAANDFQGCLPGIYEILRRQGLLEGIWCLNEKEQLGPGQSQEIDRVCRAYPHLMDDAFVASGRDRWLSG